MVSQDLLKILACPETKQPLKPAESGQLAKLNDAIARGTLLNRAGRKVAAPLDGALVREDGKFLYPVQEGIPVMLIEESIPLEGVY